MFISHSHSGFRSSFLLFVVMSLDLCSRDANAHIKLDIRNMAKRCNEVYTPPTLKNNRLSHVLTKCVCIFQPNEQDDI